MILLTKADGNSSSNFEYVEIFNSSKVNYTRAVETKKYLFLIEKGKPMYVISKMSNYLSITSQWPADNIVDVSTRSYGSDFPSVGNSSKVLALIDKEEDGSSYSLLNLNLSQIVVTCHPLTSLLSYWWGEDTSTIKFNVLEVNDEYAHVPKVIFEFNVYNVYNFGRIGTFFWVWIWVNFTLVVLIMVCRLLRLGVKRRSQMKRIDGLKKFSLKNSYKSHLTGYGEELDHYENMNRAHKSESEKPVLEMTSKGEKKCENLNDSDEANSFDR